jgi:hypothetical protein
VSGNTACIACLKPLSPSTHAISAYVTTSCICGNAGDPYLACRCSPEVLVAWQRRPAFQAALAADLVVEAAHTSAEQRMGHRRGRRGEPDEQLIARAMEARSRPRPTDALDGACQRLLAAAIRQLQLTTEQVARMLSAARASLSWQNRRRSSQRISLRRSNTGRVLRQSSISWSQIRGGSTTSESMPSGTAESRSQSGVAPGSRATSQITPLFTPAGRTSHHTTMVARSKGIRNDSHAPKRMDSKR